MYADQKRMQAIVQAEGAPIDEYLALLEKLQGGNIDRGKRLDGMLDEELADLDSPTTQPATPDEEAQAVRRQHEVAKQVLTQVMDTFTATRTALAEQESDEAAPLIDRGVEQVETLRRLYFSIVEHLKETAQRHSQLMDDTRDTAALENTPAEPLAERQKELSTFSQQLTESLKAQSRQQGMPGTSGQPGPPGAGHGAEDVAGQLLKAANAVGEAVEAMDDAAGKLGADPPQLKEAAEPQQTALSKLIEAITLLEPPQQQQQQNQDQQQDRSQGQQEEDQEKERQEQQQQQQMDLRHLLQSVRDREAQRQRDRLREPAGYQPVEKDW
jgi:hypothetical protein